MSASVWFCTFILPKEVDYISLWTQKIDRPTDIATYRRCELQPLPHCSLNSLPPDDAALVAVVPLHVEVTVVSDGEDVGRQFADLLVGVEANLVGRVDGQQLVRVDGHQDGAGVRLHTERKWRSKRENKTNFLIFVPLQNKQFQQIFLFFMGNVQQNIRSNHHRQINMVEILK